MNINIDNYNMKGGENMKNINKIMAISGVLTLVFSNVGSVLAVTNPLDNTTSTTVTQKVNLGALTMQAPATVTMPDADTNSEVVRYNGEQVTISLDAK